MSKNPFVILGVDENTVTQSELEDAYKRERNKYAEDRFLEGEAGEIATRKISEIDQAYAGASARLSADSRKSELPVSL